MLDGAWALRSGRPGASAPRGPSLRAAAAEPPWATAGVHAVAHWLPPPLRFLSLSAAQQPEQSFTLCSPHLAPVLQPSHDVHIGSRGEADRPHGARAPEPPPCAPVCRSPPPSASCLRRCGSSLGTLSRASAPSGWNVFLLHALSVSSCSASRSSLSGYHFQELLSHPQFPHTAHHAGAALTICLRFPVSFFSTVSITIWHMILYLFYLPRCLITIPHTLNLPRTWVSKLLL